MKELAKYFLFKAVQAKIALPVIEAVVLPFQSAAALLNEFQKHIIIITPHPPPFFFWLGNIRG